MKSSRPSFKELKALVGIDDVAYALGYRLDRKAGVGKYIELVLGKDGDRQDTIIVGNHRDKAAQTFFRRDGSKGDVVTFIKENLGSFNAQGKDDWQKVADVMAKLANMPSHIEELEEARSKTILHTLDSERYEIRPIVLDNPPYILGKRGFNQDTITKFAPFMMLVKDKNNTKFNGYNVGFPYSSDGETVTGIEMRGGNGFKSKAAGSDSTTAAWVAVFSNGNPDAVKSIFFCESAFDAMAFWQLNKTRLEGKDIALVSLGGTFSDRQVLNVMGRYPNARAIDCFDNDLPGRIYGLRMACLLEDIPLVITRTDNGLLVKAKEKEFSLAEDKVTVSEFNKHVALRYKLGQWQPPKIYKDWNDVVLGKKMQTVVTPSKYEVEDNLRNNRQSGMKL